VPPIDASPARWITAPGPDPQNPQLRTVVEVPSPVRSATLRLTGLGTFRAHLGGREVGPGRLDPGLTDPRARIQVCELDVTTLLSPGRSVLGIELGRGFHALTTPTVWRWEQAPWHGPVRAWAHLHAELEDGSTLEAATGEHWQVRPGPITADSMYAGETFEPSGDPGAWLEPGAEEDGWTQAVLADDAADGPLVPQRQPPVHEIERITPAVVSATPERLVLDMGRVIAGWCEYALAASVPPERPRPAAAGPARREAARERGGGLRERARARRPLPGGPGAPRAGACALLRPSSQLQGLPLRADRPRTRSRGD